MNAYLTEIMKKREAVAEKKGRYEEKCNFASKLLEAGKMTIDEIVSLTGLGLTEVMNLAREPRIG